MFQRCILPPSSGRWWRQSTSSVYLNGLHGAVSQKAVVFILAAVSLKSHMDWSLSSPIRLSRWTYNASVVLNLSSWYLYKISRSDKALWHSILSVAFYRYLGYVHLLLCFLLTPSLKVTMVIILVVQFSFFVRLFAVGEEPVPDKHG
jgi:hypothetical protein